MACIMTSHELLHYLTLDDDFTAEIVCRALVAAGHQVERGVDARGRECLLSGAVSVAVFDASRPGARGMLDKLKERAPHTRTVLLLPAEQAAVETVRLEGEATLVEPIEVADVKTAIDAQLAEFAANPSASVVTLAVPPDEAAMDEARRLLAERLAGVAVLDDAERDRLMTAFDAAARSLGAAGAAPEANGDGHALRVRYEQSPERVAIFVGERSAEGPPGPWAAADASASTTSDALEIRATTAGIAIEMALPSQPRAV